MTPLAEREAKFATPPGPRTLEQRWVLATQGILTELNETSHLRIGGEPRPERSFLSAFRLREHWNVRSKAEVERCIEWLFKDGHRFAYARDLDRSPDDFLAWDLVRASAVAGWAYVAYHLELEASWAAMVRAARALRAHFTSWADVGASYGAGRDQWSPGQPEEIQRLVAQLVAPGGGWDLPWEVDLSGDIPPPLPDAVLELVVDPAAPEGGFRTIGAALASSKAPKRVRVKAGEYVESVRIGVGTELVAEGEVTIRCSEGAPIVVNYPAYVRGFHLVSGSNAEGHTMHTVWVGDDYLRIVDCTMVSARCGLYAGTDGGFVIAESCRVTSAANSGMLVENKAHLAIVDSSIENTKGPGLLAQGSGELHVEGLRIRGAAGPSLSVRGTTTAELDRVDIEGGLSNGLEVLERAGARITHAAIRGCKGTGAFFNLASDTVTTMDDSTSSGNLANDAGVVTGRVTIRTTKLGGGPACGLCVLDGGSAQLEDCEILAGPIPSAMLMQGSVSALLGCKIRSEDDVAVFAKHARIARLVDCEITTTKKHAVLFRGVGEGRVIRARIESGTGCLFVDEGGKTLVRGASFRGGDPAVCIQKESLVAFVDSTITGEGKIAAAVELGARAEFTRTKIVARNGAALQLEGGEASVLGGSLDGVTATATDAESRLRVTGATLTGAQAAAAGLPITATDVAPFSVCILPGGVFALEIDAAMFRPAFAAVGRSPDVELCPLWIDTLVGERNIGGIALDTMGELVVVESTNAGALYTMATVIRDTLANEEALKKIGAMFEIALEQHGEGNDDEQDEDEDEEEEEEEEDEGDSDDGDEDDDGSEGDEEEEEDA